MALALQLHLLLSCGSDLDGCDPLGALSVVVVAGPSADATSDGVGQPLS